MYVNSYVASLGTLVGWPLAGSVIVWKKHMVARIKVEQFYTNEEGTRIIDDFGGFGPWEEFIPTAWMAGAYSVKEERDEETDEPGANYGTIVTMETSLCYPWRIEWRSRYKDLTGTDWTYVDHAETVGPGGTYRVELDAGEGQERYYYDSMILYPAD